MHRRAGMLVLICGLAASGHGVHASLTSVQYVEASHSLEIVMVMSADDVQTLLRRDTGKQVEVDRDAEKLVFDYVRKSLEIRPAKADAKIPLTWVGMEVSVQKITAYLEAKTPPEGPDGLRVRNDLLFDLLGDQVNILSVKRAAPGAAGGGKVRASEHLFQAAAKGGWQTVKLP